MVPLLSVSMFVNIAFSPWISSSERFSAITYNHIHKLYTVLEGKHNQIQCMYFCSDSCPYIMLRRLKNESTPCERPLDKYTFNASFFNLFIALNCFILESTALSMGLSDASPPSLIHGCSKLAIQIQKFQLDEKSTTHNPSIKEKEKDFARTTIYHE